ncbi:LOW QUALITY PROTEIN: Threonine dehydratase 1 biosynthetic, chloroplastic [Turnera subulata]|uniref:Threonine dehydratase n=1 Tax=Turnera subulata TaxID=218843 RepID=A0A9Q0GBG8_9ROSI|nr:LOW QUALITY PROTEIN: Threonine dehydratase 1 biosynthetic, chloroplastic [Turnera subulata]
MECVSVVPSSQNPTLFRPKPSKLAPSSSSMTGRCRVKQFISSAGLAKLKATTEQKPLIITAATTKSTPRGLLANSHLDSPLEAVPSVVIINTVGPDSPQVHLPAGDPVRAVPAPVVRSQSDQNEVAATWGTDAMGYLTNILSSKVYEVAIESPLQLAPKLTKRIGVNVWLKREDLQPVFSFKLRGAYNMMAKLPKEKLEVGVICSSAGNHAQGVALAAKRLGCTAVIAMPLTTPEIKWQAAERLGATVVLVGDSYDEAQAYAKQRSKEEGRTFIPPFDHPDVIVGQGTVGMEILRQMQQQAPIHAIFVPVGGGGLIAGIAAFVKRVYPEIIGVEPSDANAMALSLYYGERVVLQHVGDGVAVKEVGEETFRLCKELIDGIVLVSRDAICASIKDMFDETRSILEPAGALSLAGAEAYCKHYGIRGQNVVAITSGANMNFDKLKLVTEIANVHPSNSENHVMNLKQDIKA